MECSCALIVDAQRLLVGSVASANIFSDVANFIWPIWKVVLGVLAVVLVLVALYLLEWVYAGVLLLVLVPAILSVGLMVVLPWILLRTVWALPHLLFRLALMRRARRKGRSIERLTTQLRSQGFWTRLGFYSLIPIWVGTALCVYDLTQYGYLAAGIPGTIGFLMILPPLLLQVGIVEEVEMFIEGLDWTPAESNASRQGSLP